MAQEKNKTQEKQPFLILSGKKTAGWAGVFVTVLSVTFFAGTLVGRGMITVDLGQKKLSAEINTYAQRLENGNSENVEIIEDAPDLIFYESLGTKEPQQKNVQQSSGSKKTPLARKTKKVVKHKRTPYKPIETVKKTVRVAPVKQSTARTAAKDPAVFKYSIQVASFKGLKEAKKTVELFQKKGYSAYFVKAVVRESEIWYRVRIGAFKDRIDAKKTLARLERNKVEGFLVTR